MRERYKPLVNVMELVLLCSGATAKLIGESNTTLLISTASTLSLASKAAVLQGARLETSAALIIRQ